MLQIIRQIKRSINKNIILLEPYIYLKFQNKFYSTSTEGILTTIKNIKNRKTNTATHLEDKSQVINEHEDILSQCVLKVILKKTKRTRCLYLNDKKTARNFASIIVDDLVKKKNPIILEVNPGFGYLTEKLLEAGFSQLHLYEATEEFLPYLKPIVEEYPQCLTVKPYNFLTFGKLDYIDEVSDNNNVANIFEGIETREWNDKSSICIIGALPDIKFLYYLQFSQSYGYLSNYGRITLYVAIPPSVSLALTDTRNKPIFHKAKNIYLQCFFNYEKLGHLSRSAYFPQYINKRRKNLVYYLEDSTLMHVVKLVPKPDFFNDDFTKEDAEIFYYFLRVHMKRRDSRIIPIFEKWIPNCGPRLIKLNINIFTKFSQFSALELLNLFKIFKSWPEYKSSLFMTIVNDIRN